MSATDPPEPSPTCSPLDTPCDPNTWPAPTPRPVPKFTQDTAGRGAALSVVGKHLLDGIRGYAAEHNLEIDGLPKDAKADIPPNRSLAFYAHS